VAAFQENGVALRWNASPEPDIAGYEVYRREEGGEPLRKISPELIKDPYFLDPTANPQKTHVYGLKAIDSSGKESGFSQEATVSPQNSVSPK